MFRPANRVIPSSLIRKAAMDIKALNDWTIVWGVRSRVMRHDPAPNAARMRASARFAAIIWRTMTTTDQAADFTRACLDKTTSPKR